MPYYASLSVVPMKEFLYDVVSFLFPYWVNCIIFHASYSTDCSCCRRKHHFWPHAIIPLNPFVARTLLTTERSLAICQGDRVSCSDNKNASTDTDAFIEEKKDES
jgi:hypothetical protein